MTRYAPGPWNVCEPTTWPPDYDLPAERLRATWTVGVRPGGAIAFVAGADPEQAEANARLLSAAPELLAACEMILDVRTCMLLQCVHADFLMHEILERHDVPSVQLLAKKAQDLAKIAVAKATGGGPDAARPAPAAG